MPSIGKHPLKSHAFIYVEYKLLSKVLKVSFCFDLGIIEKK